MKPLFTGRAAEWLVILASAWKNLQQAFFHIFEKTQARKNSTTQKTQQFFRPKLNEPVAIVVT